MFPIIDHFDDVAKFVENNPQFRIAKQDNGISVICYMLQDEDTFHGENQDIYRECRGISFHENGKIASRPLHKFFNVGESTETSAENIPWDKIVRCTDKRDGSMITFVLMPDGNIIGKTKKTFDSAEAIAATKFLYENEEKLNWVRHWLENNLTPIFEWTSPSFPIVILYDKDELTLLQLRCNYTGNYALTYFENNNSIPFPICENLLHKFNTPKDLLTLAKTETGIEGWIIQDSIGNAWKIKTQWYCDLHHSVTFTRWRDIARSVLVEQSDDLKAAFKLTGRDIAPIVNVEHAIMQTILTHQEMCKNETENVDKSDAKTFALAKRKHPHFNILMQTFNNKEIDWYKWYEKHFLNSWSLEVVV